MNNAMRVNRNVTHEIFTTIQVDEIVVEPGDTAQNIIEMLETLALSAKIVEVDSSLKGSAFADGGVSLLFEAKS